MNSFLTFLSFYGILLSAVLFVLHILSPRIMSFVGLSFRDRYTATGVFLLCGTVFIALTAIFQSDEPSFRCPEDYATVEEYVDRLSFWISEYVKANPAATEDDLIKVRKGLMTIHHCTGRNDAGSIEEAPVQANPNEPTA